MLKSSISSGSVAFSNFAFSSLYLGDSVLNISAVAFGVGVTALAGGGVSARVTVIGALVWRRGCVKSTVLGFVVSW